MFNRALQLILCTVSALAVVAPTAAAEASTAAIYEKNGLPCLAELCIGDGLSELKKVNWKEADASFRRAPSLDNINKAKSKFRGEIPNGVVDYLLVRSFSSEALDMLSGITAVCEENRGLSGTFVSRGGSTVIVYIELIAKSKGSTEQQWTVVKMEQYLGTSNEQDAKEAGKQLAERYKKFIANKSASYKLTNDFGGFSYTLELTNWKTPRPPQCAIKANID